MTNSKRRKIPFWKRYSLAERIMIVVLSVFALVCLCLCGVQIVKIMQKQQEPRKADHIVRPDGNDILAEPMPEGTVLTETKDAGKEYIDETLFLGDSNTVRFMTFFDEDGLTYTSAENTIAVIGMGADAISTLACMQFDIGTFTMVDSVAILQPRRIILTFGTNNLDGFTNDATFFIEQYEPQIKAVQEAYPYADIIIQSIFPIAQFNDYPNLKNSQIRLFNAAIIQMCEQNDWKYLNTFEMLYDSASGFAKTELMDTDGLHLSEKGVAEVISYVRTHAYITDDRRPQPLEEIPLVYGPKTDMLDINPLTSQPFDPEIFTQPETEPEIPVEEYTPQEAPAEEPYVEPEPVPEETPEEIPPEIPPEGETSTEHDGE